MGKSGRSGEIAFERDVVDQKAAQGTHALRSHMFTHILGAEDVEGAYVRTTQCRIGK